MSRVHKARASTWFGHRTVAVTLGAASLCLSSVAFAQQAQPGPVQPSETPPQRDWSDTTTTTPTTPTTPKTPMPHGGTEPYSAPQSTIPPATSTTQTTAAEYQEGVGAEAATGYRPNRPLLVTGATIFGATYLASVIVGAASPLKEDEKLFIPVVGPWLDLGTRPCSFGSECSTSDNIAGVLLIGSGIAQGAGVIMALASLAVPEGRSQSAKVAQKPHVNVVPISLAGGGGVGAVGTF